MPEPHPEERASRASRRMKARLWPAWFETRYALLTMRDEDHWRMMMSEYAAGSSLLPLWGRDERSSLLRWREAPDEGFSPQLQSPSCGDRPLIRLAAAFAASIHLLPEGEK